MTKTYDRAYFDRWYRHGGIGHAARLARKVALAVATAEYHLERPIRSVLDIGCGEGAWRAPLRSLRMPTSRFTSSRCSSAMTSSSSAAGKSPIGRPSAPTIGNTATPIPPARAAACS